ncbi:MAG: phage holin family protein [Minisyncoccia bacterium]
MKLILHIALLSAGVYGAAYFIPATIHVNPWYITLIVGACLTVINMVVKPIINILTLPINIITLGLFSIVINGAIFFYLGSGLVRGFTVDTWMAALYGSIIVSVINWLGTKILRLENE